MRKVLLLQFSFFAVVIAALGMAAFGLLLWDFLWPGTFKFWYISRGGMSLNLVLLVSFGLQHSIMARASFKKVWTSLIPKELERSSYVMFSGFVLFVMALLWSPTAPPLYDLRGTWAMWPPLALAGTGALIVAFGSRGMGSLDLLGIQSVLDIARDREPQPVPFQTPFLYKHVRHPLYLGLLMLFWFTPAMTHDHLFFAEVMTAYVLIGIRLEERSLVRTFGQQYRDYQEQVPMLIPRWKPYHPPGHS